MPCTLYVLRLNPPRHFYVGTTVQPFENRLKEHREGRGSIWTTRHGVHSVVEHYVVPKGWGSRLENAKTIDYMRRFGWQGVRGGDYTNCRPGETWWLPPEFQADGVSKFGLYPASRCTASAFPPSAPSRVVTQLQCPGP